MNEGIDTCRVRQLDDNGVETARERKDYDCVAQGDVTSMTEG
jgi:hypothetical protein